MGWRGYCPGSQRSCPDPTWLVLDFSRLPAVSSPQALLRLGLLPGGTFSHLKHQSIPAGRGAGPGISDCHRNLAFLRLLRVGWGGVLVKTQDFPKANSHSLSPGGSRMAGAPQALPIITAQHSALT